MVIVLSNLNTTMCHVFICDKTLMPPLLNFDSKSLGEEGTLMYETTNYKQDYNIVFKFDWSFSF
jgi:hypothetical protein